ARQAPAQDGADVVDLDIHRLQPWYEPVPHVVGGSPAGGDVVVRAALVEEVHFVGVAQLETGVLPHRLVQPVPGQPGQVLLHHERLVDQGRQQVQRVGGHPGVNGADAADVVEVEAAGEHRQPAQQPLLVAGQEVVAPCDGGVERLVAGQPGPAARGEQDETVGQPVEDLRGTQ